MSLHITSLSPLYALASSTVRVQCSVSMVRNLILGVLVNEEPDRGIVFLQTLAKSTPRVPFSATKILKPIRECFVP
jgi:hypothetical protein